MNKLFRNITVPKTAIRQHVVALINSAKWNVERQLLNLSLNLENDLAHRNRRRSGDGTHWFIAEEAVLIDVLASLLVPSDENTPGANEMDVMGLRQRKFSIS
jgi:hypothetical protein